jgi:RNA polymerase sigma-70 factor (ECF subfamily)
VSKPVNISAGPTDEHLMIAFARGDEGAFRTLFQRHAGATLAFLHASTANREAAEDLLQETFARVCRHRDDWRDGLRGGEGDSFRGWLFAIARNLARDAGRRASVRRKASEEPEKVFVQSQPDAPPDRNAEGSAFARGLVDALTRIPDAQREAFVLVRLQELSYEEVAAACGTTVGATKMRVARATAALASLLSDHLDPPAQKKNDP